ncbi:MAG: hypothetical protein WKG01_15320 [Kofleriaceae bacterium]
MIARLALSLAFLVAACGKKSEGPTGPLPEVTGLAAVPANAEAMIAVDVGKVASAPIVERMVEQLLMRDPSLSAGWAKLRASCKLDFTKQIRRLMLAIGPTGPDGRIGTGPVLMVATGTIPEAEFADCVGKLVGQGGGNITGATKGGRTLYQVKDGARSMFFAFGRADTVVLGSNDAYVLEALGPGKKALDNPELAAWVKLADQNAPIWAVGRMSDKLRRGLVDATDGKIKQGPVAVTASIDPTTGMNIQVAAIMATPDDAKRLESLMTTEKALIGIAAQIKSLGPIVERVKVMTERNVLRFRAPLTMDDVNHLLSVLDGPKPAQQDSPPASAGSASPP